MAHSVAGARELPHEPDHALVSAAIGTLSGSRTRAGHGVGVAVCTAAGTVFTNGAGGVGVSGLTNRYSTNVATQLPIRIAVDLRGLTDTFPAQRGGYPDPQLTSYFELLTRQGAGDHPDVHLIDREVFHTHDRRLVQ